MAKPMFQERDLRNMEQRPCSKSTQKIVENEMKNGFLESCSKKETSISTRNMRFW